MYIYLLSMGFKKKTDFWHIYFVRLKKLPITGSVEAQKTAWLYVPICQI